MRTTKSCLGLSITALVAVLTCVFLFSGVVYAEEDPLPLSVNERIITDKTQVIEEKNNVLSNAIEEIKVLESKKQMLADELAGIKSEVDSMKQQLAEKKAAEDAERKRVEELKAMFVHVNRYARDSAGNTYAPGNCTWGVKSWRPDISNSWGNANTWYERASAQGWDVGDAPKKGAIGTTAAGAWGHVVFIIGVSLDRKTVTVKEMNYVGLGVVSTRDVSSSEFRYIYELN